MRYAYLAWSVILLALWSGVYLWRKRDRAKILRMSFYTSLLGLTEPLFVPAYWHPATLFGLADRIHFDLESLLFAFAAGGLASSLYEAVIPARSVHVDKSEQHRRKHRYHALALSAPLWIFPLLYLSLPFNVIYIASLSMLLSGLTALLCRPDLWRSMLIGAAIFSLLYFLFFMTLTLAYPGYVASTWNLKQLSGIILFGMPAEELLFALSLGFMWSGLYEHVYWQKWVSPRPLKQDHSG